MIYQAIHDAFGAPGLFILTLTFGMLLYAVLAGGSYLLFFVLWRQRFVPVYQPNSAEMKKSVVWSFHSVAGNSVFVLPVQLLIVFGNSRVYYELEPYGWTYLFVSFVGVIVVAETMIYWIHRTLHTKWIYRHIHSRHHAFREPTPLASVAFHPIDSFAQAAPYHLFALLVPINFWLYLAMIVFVTFWSVMIHDRIRWVPSKIINHTGCHTAHHWYNNYNFGQYFTFWDRLCGTYRDPNDLPDKFTESKVPVYKMARRDIAAAE